MNDPDTSSAPSTPEGVFVTLDELQYTHHPVNAPEDRPHLFTYHLTIHNHSPNTITILARKWILTYPDGQVDVIEGDKVVGKTPTLSPGKSFSYASFHLVPANALVRGAFHGIVGNGDPFVVPMPEFTLSIPGNTTCN